MAAELAMGFRGTSDTEVLVEAIAKFGIDGALARANGIFAFAAFDRASRTLHVARDRLGDMAMGYSVSNASTYPQIRYAARLAADPLGTLAQGEGILYTGQGAQTYTNRWGDYSAMSLDPDGCTFWYTGELYVATGRDWQTGIAAFSLPGCTGTPPPPPPAPVLVLGSASDGGTAIADPGSVRLTWTPPPLTPMSGLATAYRIERSTGTGWIAVGSASAGETWRDLSVLPATTYAYRIVALNPGGEAPASPATVIRTGPAPAAPSSLAVASAAQTTLTVGWKDNSPNEYGFEVQFATVSTGPCRRSISRSNARRGMRSVR